jgi:hypothetical protein
VDTLPFGAFVRAKGVSVGDERLRRNERISPRLGKDGAWGTKSGPEAGYGDLLRVAPCGDATCVARLSNGAR